MPRYRFIDQERALNKQALDVLKQQVLLLLLLLLHHVANALRAGARAALEERALLSAGGRGACELHARADGSGALSKRFVRPTIVTMWRAQIINQGSRDAEKCQRRPHPPCFLSRARDPQVRCACCEICQENKQNRGKNSRPGTSHSAGEAAGGARCKAAARCVLDPPLLARVKNCDILQSDLLRPDPEDDSHVLGLEQVQYLREKQNRNMLLHVALRRSSAHKRWQRVSRASRHRPVT
jgi:hypothetical protein